MPDIAKKDLKWIKSSHRAISESLKAYNITIDCQSRTHQCSRSFIKTEILL